MKKGLLWAILIVLVLGVILFTLANKDQVEQGASEVTDSAERVIENVEAEIDAELDDEDEPGDVFEGDASVDAETDNNDEGAVTSETTVDADAQLGGGDAVEAEVDPSFESQN